MIFLAPALVLSTARSASIVEGERTSPLNDDRMRFNSFRAMAEKGEVAAQVELGLCYMEGRGVSKNPEEAARWFRKAAEKGSSSAKQSLGVAYSKGVGVPKDQVEAVKWFRKAAEEGDAYAQNDLGLCYAEGEGVAVNMTEAAKWFTASAKQGNAAGQYDLGNCYVTGFGVVKDDAQAIKWFRKAAEQGYGAAFSRLGAMLEVRGEFAEAAEWYLKGANQGIASAQFGLAGCYCRGKGVEKDYVEAYRWLVRSDAGGVTESLKILNFIMKQMTPEQIREGQRRSGLPLQPPQPSLADKEGHIGATNLNHTTPTKTNQTISTGTTSR